jgi:acyl-coenzyme A synthetase/AMP-(fatty) acid ligase
MPDVLALGRWWSGDELDAIARGWRAVVLERLDPGERLIAAAVPASPEAVALLVALSSLESPLVLLAPDTRVWRTEPAVPLGTKLVLLPTLAHLAPEAERFGLIPIVLPAASECRVGGRELVPLTGPGFVVFTSGSTGPPKPIFQRTPALLEWLRVRMDAAGLVPGAGGVALEASPAYNQGLTFLLTAILLGGPVGLLDPRDHRLALAALAEPSFQCWRATPHFAEVLARCALTGPAIVPSVCILSNPIPRTVFETFRERFGVPLRQAYSCTETGTITLDTGPPDDVQPETVGRPLPGVELRIGDHPGEPRAPGELGRIWARTPGQTAGYGFPPDVERLTDADGWWRTQDRGMLRPDGRLILAGRLDDAIRTKDNRVVNLTFVAASLRSVEGVTDALVLPLDTPAGRSLGAVVACEPSLSLATLRARLAETLPPWSWPRTIELVPTLPRLSNGKPDRQACALLLGGAPGGVT